MTKREAEEEVIAAADAFYDLAHATLPELRMVESWKEVSARIDKAVQALRKIRAVEYGKAYLCTKCGETVLNNASCPKCWA